MDESKIEEVKTKKSLFDVLKWPAKKQSAPTQPAVVETPLEEVRRKRGRPKVNEDREAEIQKKQTELLSSLSQTGSQENPIDVDKDVPSS